MKANQLAFQRQSLQKGSIELLLVLCCLVGVVIFFSFTLGIAGIIHDHPGFDGLPDIQEIQQRLEKLRQQEDIKDNDLNVLKKSIKRHQEQIKLSNKKLNPDSNFSNKEALENRISSLTNELTSLSNQIIHNKKGLKTLDQISTDSLEIKLKELDKIKDKLRNLDKLSIDISRKLPQIGRPKERNANLAKKRNEVVRELAALEEKRSVIRQKIKKAEVANLWGGTGNFKNPLFVECVKGGVIFYPGNQMVSNDKLGQSGLFKKMTSKHDAIVMLVRPDGFESYRKSYWKVISTKKKVSYEPIDAETSLEFLQ